MRFGKRNFLLFGVILLAAFFLIWLSYFQNKLLNNYLNIPGKINQTNINSNYDKFQNYPKVIKKPSEIVIATVACGMRLQETLAMLKSAIIFNLEGAPIKFLILTEPNLMVGFKEKLEDWRTLSESSFSFEILPINFPIKNAKEWRSLFRPCAAQRLFLPSLLKHTDSILYLDTDTLFISPPSDVWNFFSKFNSTQIAALSAEHEDSNIGWYNRFARHPFYGELGVNSGVMLMNLTRMRSFKWEEYILPLYKEFKLKITFGDQDLINILFYYHPDKLYVIPCEYNYRSDHCMYNMNTCNLSDGIKILHGNRGYFHMDKQPVFSVTYQTILECEIGGDMFQNFLLPFELNLSNELVTKSNCAGIIDKILWQSKRIFKEVDVE